MVREKKGFALEKYYSKIYRRYDLINRLFTFGLDQKWRRITAEKCLLNNPHNIIDLCCGTGDLAFAICKLQTNNIRITGYDFNENMLEIAKRKADKEPFKTINFIKGEASDLPFESGSIDAITIGFGFRNLTFENLNREKHISEMYRVLARGGSIYILESSVPDNFIIRILYKLYLYLFLIPLGSVISGNPKAYWYLAHSSSNFYNMAEVRTLLLKNGFENVKSHRFMFGAANLIIAQK